MDYYKYSVTNDPALTEVLIAMMSEQAFDTFQETEMGFDAYLPASGEGAGIADFLDKLKGKFPFTYQKEFIKGENWNVEWERNFHPVQVGSFCGIRADFHPPFEGVEHELVIHPKMAFGTGHHETTFSVIQLMQGIDFSGENVLDFGCGTGILAILASRLGAAAIAAVDMEEESYWNTMENCQKNGVFNVKSYHGILEDVPAATYGTVLANINRNVILNSLIALSKLVNPGGLLVISGFILGDEKMMEKAVAESGFTRLETVRKNNWLAMKCQRG